MSGDATVRHATNKEEKSKMGEERGDESPRTANAEVTRRKRRGGWVCYYTIQNGWHTWVGDSRGERDIAVGEKVMRKMEEAMEQTVS